MAEADLRTLGLGYLRAYHRLHEISLATTASDELFIPLHETMGWLYSLLLRKEIRMEETARIGSSAPIRSRTFGRYAARVNRTVVANKE